MITSLIKQINSTILNEYIAQLEHLSQYEVWEYNVYLQNSLKELKSHLEELAVQTSFYEFIADSFNWSETEEGHDFWYSIARKHI